MITETATVVAVNGDRVTVSASVKTACGSCQAADDCGTSAVAKAFSPKQQTFDLVSPLPLKAGDLVTLGIPEAHLLSVQKTCLDPKRTDIQRGCMLWNGVLAKEK